MTNQSSQFMWVFPLFFLITILLSELVSPLSAISFGICAMLIFSKLGIGRSREDNHTDSGHMIVQYGVFFIVLVSFAFEKDLRSCKALHEIVPYVLILLINNVILYTGWRKWRENAFKHNHEKMYYLIQFISIGYVLYSFITHYDFFVYHLQRVPACMGL